MELFVYVHVHACGITHAIDNNGGNNNVGDTAENAPNMSLNDWGNHLITNSDGTDGCRR